MLRRRAMFLCGLLVFAAAGLLLLPSASQQPSDALPWTTYNGSTTGNRYSTLALINTANVATLTLQHAFDIETPAGLETTPVVYGSEMFITSGNSLYAYSLATHNLLWSLVRPKVAGIVQDAGGGGNRGAAIAPGISGSPATVYYVTNDAHLLALNAASGAQMWEAVVADYSLNYGSTSAPLYLPGPNLVVAGVSGGDSGVRGMLTAYNATTGAPVWQFFTTPATTDDPVAASWGDGSILPHGCGATWTTGTYDSSANLLYWGVGNPCPDLNGDDRQGDNLYTSSVVALDPNTGTLKWYFQFTPHGLWDFDGANTSMLIDTPWQGKHRHLLFHANRNGYFYVLDRMSGLYLSGFPFVSNLNWATGLDATGRPIVNPAATPTPAGTLSCPSGAGAANWPSVAYSAPTGLFYVQANESCAIRASLSPAPVWQAGTEYNAGVTSIAQVSEKHLRAINPTTGSIVWDYPEPGYHPGFGGVLATAGGLVFVAEDDGAFSALDARTGATLWTYQESAGAKIKGSPMTYQYNGRQFVAVSVTSPGSDKDREREVTEGLVLLFALPANPPAVTQACPANTAGIGTAYSSAAGVTGGTPPYSYSIGSGALPAGLSLDSSTGEIAGSPTKGGTAAFVLKVADSAGNHASSHCGITVLPMPLRQFCASAAAAVGVLYGYPLTGKGGVLPYAFSITAGTLPPGLAMNPVSGAITGTPTATGDFPFTAQLVDSSGIPVGTVASNCEIEVRHLPTAACPAGAAPLGSPYSSMLTATGGKPPYNLFSIVAGSLPPGLTLDHTNGTIAGMPSVAGSYAFTGSIADSTGSAAGIATADCGITVQ